MKGITADNITSHYYKPTKHIDLHLIQYAQLYNISHLNYFLSAIAAVVNGNPFDSSNALEELCLVSDDCFASCMNASASGGITLTFKRGNICHSVVDTISKGLKEIYTDAACLGIGSGNSSVMVTYITKNGSRFQSIANNTANPLSIYACLIGGRIPYDTFPTLFLDMFAQGSQASLVISCSNGSEDIVLNFIALVSLLGYVYFFFCIAHFLITKLLWTYSHPQLSFSLIKCNVSSVVWNSHRGVMVVSGYLGLVAWHIGACELSCKWNDQAMIDIAVDPVYTCTVNPLGHFQSFGEIIRLVSQAWVFFALVHLDRMPGIGCYARGYTIAVFYLGFVPLSMSAIIVAKASTIRTEIIAMSTIHNQLFLATLWLVVILLMRTRLFSPYISFVEWCLGLTNIKKQPVSRKSLFYHIVGDHYWTHSALRQSCDAEYVPLSLLLQTKGVNANNIYDHEYFTYRDTDSCIDFKPNHPQWIETQLEYYVRVHD
ncbi:hypothetical protein THRCLA_00331 [Thraustotheca clavata]|uniref:Transmembrane protein n=1 Tax=Thraustotheca clavata TaxID=74557 RepID=A0A1W0ACD0_9STRA|nr:hypothetical protein THRCLA_00331 [Thraustotheca clavata]